MITAIAILSAIIIFGCVAAAIVLIHKKRRQDKD